MNINQETDLTAFISREGSQLITDSRAVAIAFGRRHKNVMQAIERMRRNQHPEIAEHARLNFQPCTYVAGNQRTEPMYRITAKGLSELAMSFSGDLARVIRIRFINAFEEVSARLLRAEQTITEQLHELERREAPSKIKGQIGSRLMLERKREKPDFETQRFMLESLSQPSLLN